MQTYIALLRGINVGGKNKLPMQELKLLLEKNGLFNVQTYIQTGNILFESNNFDCDLSQIINSSFGFKPDVLILTKTEFLSSIDNCPFSVDEGKLLHYYFCKTAPDADLDKMHHLQKDNEDFVIIGNVFYLYAPDGIGRSKLAKQAEKLLRVSCTARNLNTVLKLKNMLGDS